MNRLYGGTKTFSFQSARKQCNTGHIQPVSVAEHGVAIRLTFIHAYILHEVKGESGGVILFLSAPMKLFQALRNGGCFRTAFDFGERQVAHWFPGHMAKGDCV